MKKKIAINMWEQITPILNDHSELITRVDSGNNALRLEDADDDSDFFFEFGLQNGDGTYKVKLKPADMSSVREFEKSMKTDELLSALKVWLEILEKYAKTPSPYDDPILRSYENMYYESFASSDLDADVTPYAPVQLLMIDGYLQKVQVLLDKQKKEANSPDEIEELQKIENDCRNLRKQLTTAPKNVVLKKLAKIWGRATKFGLPLIKQFMKEAKTELLKEGAKAIIKAGQEGINLIDLM